MKYVVRIWALGSHPEIKIDRVRYDELNKARNYLSTALAIEEKYELLLSNYLDLEKECLNISSEYMVRNSTGYSDFFDIRLAFNRRIVNLLTSTRLYIDQIKQHVQECMPDDENIVDKIKSLLSTEYDKYFEYRFMEAIRNYVQHRGLAVHSTSLGGKWTSHEEDGALVFSTELYTHRSEVESDSAFKKKISEEMPEKVNLVYAARIYAASISKVHCDIRDMLKDDSENNRRLISNVITNYEEINTQVSEFKMAEIGSKFPITHTPIAS